MRIHVTRIFASGLLTHCYLCAKKLNEIVYVSTDVIPLDIYVLLLNNCPSHGFRHSHDIVNDDINGESFQPEYLLGVCPSCFSCHLSPIVQSLRHHQQGVGES